MHPTLIKSFVANAAIGATIFVAAHAERRKAVAASGSASKLYGVSDLGADAGGMVDVKVGGSATIRAGGTIAAGDYVTSDAQGRAIVAVAGVAVVQVGGRALEPAVEGDLFEILITHFQLPATA